jgi:ABC-type sugar transport system substrate-binding protein
MKQAKDAGIPVLALGTSVNPGFEKQYDGVFGDDIVKMGENTADYVLENYGDQPIVGLEITQNYGGQGYVEGMKKGLEAQGEKYDDLRDTNLADIVNSMKSTTEAILQDNPGKLTFIGYNDTDPVLLWPDIERLGREKDVTLITRYDNPSTVKIMRGSGGEQVLTSLSENYQHHFDMLDALLAHWTKDEALPDPASTTDTPGAKVAGVGDFPDGQDRAYPFDPALQDKIAEWEQTYDLEPSTLKAP